MMIVMLLLLPVSFYLIQYVISLAKKPNKLPPGPVPLPIIASLHKIGHHPHKSLSVLSKKYGPIMHLKLGSVSTIVISSSNAARQILQKQDQNFATRFVPDALNAHNHYEYSVAFLPANSRWRRLRKIMNSNIFSGNKLDANQHLRSKKVEELVEYCRKCSHAGEAVDIGQAAFSTSLNILSNTIFSKDLMDAFEDSGKEFRDLVRNIMIEVGKPNVVDFFPILKRIDPQGVRRRLTLHFGKMLKILGDLISDRIELRKSDEYVPNIDVIDQLLNNFEVNSDEIHQTEIEHLFLEIFAAGTDTTSSALEWAMTELVRDSRAMAKAKAELNQVMGKGKIVQEADVCRLPYLGAIVKETLRLHPSVPLLLPRKAQEETDDVCGYTIPKGSQILVNAWGIGRDPAEWDNPLAFLPERFLDSDVDFKGQHFELIPFGGGRRICPGMPLVARVVPVVLGSLLNLFDWEIEGGIQPMELDMEEKFGISLQKLHSLRAIPTCCS